MAKKLKTSTKGYKKSSPDKNEPALRIPSGRITMKDVPFPVLGIDNYGNSVIMQPGEEYQFPGSEVIEMPVLQTGGRAPIYTSNPNDPRLRAYNDSLKLYNLNPKIANEYLKVKAAESRVVFPSSTLSYNKDNTHKVRPDINLGLNGKGHGVEEYKQSVNKFREFFDNAIGKSSIQPSVKNPKYKTLDTWIPKTPKDLATGRTDLKPEQMMELLYKKPVQPVIYQPEPKIDTPKKRQTSYSRNLSIVPIEAAKPTVSQSLYDSSKPTNWSFTYPTGQYNEQKTMYFPDRDSWKKFVDQQKLSNSQETSEQGTATGYMKKGGLTPNKAREILHDGKVHGKKLTEKQRRFFGAMSKGHTKNYEHGGEMKKGGIHIDPKNKGKFTKSAKAAGMGVQEFARHVLANKEDYSPTQVKRANFARNAKKWSAQQGFEVPSGETWQFDPITGEPMGAPEKWRNEDDPVTIPGLKEHLAKIKAGVPTNPFKTTGNEGSIQNPMGAGAPDRGPEKKPSKNYLPTLNAINFGLTKFAESLRNKELERYNRQMIALQNVPQPRRLTRIEQYGDPSVYQIGGMIPEDVSYLMGTIPNFDMLPTPAKSSSGMDNVVQGAIKGTTQQAKGTPVPGSDYENVIYNTYIENGLTPQAALFLTAQTMHETANYSSNVFKKNNNVGGIKIPKTRKSPYIEGVGTSAPANESKNQKMNKYAKYKDVKSGAMDLLEWMKYNKIDPNKFNTPEEYAIALYNKSYYHEVTGVKGAETKEAAINTYSSSLKRKIEKLKKKGFEKGGEYDLSDSEIAELKAQGYDIEIID